MTAPHLECDYLIIGSGAVGMAFADVIFHESKARILIVDRHGAPGGHWNDAYPFVRLHQPSAYYGVNSRQLGGDSKDASPLNLGMCERASAAEILAYYEAVMLEFLATDRVSYFPLNNVSGDEASGFLFSSLMTGEQHTVSVAKKVVDTSFLNTAVPSTHPPKYAVAPGLKCVPPNELLKVKTPPSGYVVVGAGKTGIDACLWLLENRVSPDLITWIMPRDSWFLNRANVQPGMDNFAKSIGGMAHQMRAVAQADTVDQVLTELEAHDQLVRLDRSVQPGMFHAAVVSHAELAALREIKKIVRMGRIIRIEPNQIVLQHGSVPTDAQQLFVDCSASAVESRAAVPVFQGKKIVPQFVRQYQPTFSAALIAHIELTQPADDAFKNKLCAVVPLPDTPVSWLTMQAASMANMYRWSKVKGLSAWISASRLDGFSRLTEEVDEGDSEKIAMLEMFGENVMIATGKFPVLVALASVQA